MSEVTYTLGRFVWRELLTSDVEGAKGFYGELLGWSFKGVDIGEGGTYWLANVGETQVCGLMKKPDEVPMPSHWAGYVSVDDVDAAIARAIAEGGMSPMPAMDMPGVGRMGVILDPAGAVSWAFRSEKGDMPVKQPGLSEFCWESLAAADVEKSKAFYGKVYGWKASAFGPNMTTFGTGEGMENQVADVMAAPPGVPSHWVSNVVVAKLADSRARVEKLGGKVLMGEIAVPGIGLIAIVQDPQGATIALFEPSPAMGA
jgi:predicted enzyme related to lactoylglutathione lyase